MSDLNIIADLMTSFVIVIMYQIMCRYHLPLVSSLKGKASLIVSMTA